MNNDIFKAFPLIILFSLTLFLHCDVVKNLRDPDNPELCNPLDPASDCYIPPPNGLLIEDFNDGKIPNLLGYCHEVFLAFPAGIDTSYESQPENVLRGIGRSWRMKFDVSKGQDANAGYVELLTGNIRCPSTRGLFNVDVLDLKILTFWVKVESPEINFEVALKDIDDKETNPKRLIREYLTPDRAWKKVRIPIADLVLVQNIGKVDLTRLRQITIAFGYRRFQEVNAPLSGIIYLDEIAFER
jgi:hypothetical protein